MNALIDIKNVSVNYYMHKTKSADQITEKGSVGADIVIGQRYLEINALKDVSLSLSHGDRLGLIGINGSGKSTLLKLCAGALAAQKGTVEIKGRVSPQFALGSGIKVELSGRRNTELKCFYMGVPQSRVKDYLEEVKELSGLGGYFELPVRSYSAGMRSRLVMSLLRFVRGDIIIMDEWINTADASVNKTVSRLQSELIESSSILVLASHSKRVLGVWTDKLLWLDQGTIKMFGATNDVYAEYQKWMKHSVNRP